MLIKWPEMTGMEATVERVLRDPRKVRTKHHPDDLDWQEDELYFYGHAGEPGVLLTLVRRTNGFGFIITAFPPSHEELIDGLVVYRDKEIPWQL